MLPGNAPASIDDLIAGVSKGIAISSATIHLDHQMRGGSGRGTMREIRDGKLGAFIKGGAFAFNTMDFWKNLSALGGSDSVRRTAHGRAKGEPSQMTKFSVSAVPMTVRQVGIYDGPRGL